MGKSKKGKKSEMISGSQDTHQPGMLSSQKKKKSRKEDTSLQSTLSSYISTSSSPKPKLQPNSSNLTDGSTKMKSPKKKPIQASPSNEYSVVEGRSDESSSHIKRKRTKKDATELKKSKKMRLDHKIIDAVRNPQSNSVPQNTSYSENGPSSLPGVLHTSQSQEQENILAYKSSAKNRRNHSNISSDEGVDSGEELSAVPKSHLSVHPTENEEIEENQLEVPHQQPETDCESDWSKEQTEELIFMIKEMIKVVVPMDSMSYRCRMKILHWENLPSQLNPPRTEEECKRHLQHIVDNTNSVRNLYEILTAHKMKRAHKKPAVMNPFRRFILDRGEEIKRIEGNWIVNARRAFDALSEEEKRRYTDPYIAELAEKKALKPTPLRSTFKIFCSNHPGVSAEELKEKFQAMTPEQKLPLIKQAIKEHKRIMKNFEDKHGNDVDTKVKPPVSRLTKEEWRLFLESKGMPTLRVLSPYQLYCLERDDNDTDADAEANKNSLRRYQEFARSKHCASYELKFSEERNEFSNNYRAWFKKLTVELWKQHAHTYYTEMTTYRGGVKKVKAISKVSTKVQQLEQSYVESSMIGKFCDEPAPAPMTAKDVFKHYAKAKNPKSTPSDMNNTWNLLSQTHKDKFTEVAINNVKEYKAKLKHYAKALPDHERRVYIGQNRVRYIRVFEGTDIFEKDYPCSEYPPFRMPSKNEKKSSPEKAKGRKLDLDFDSLFKTSSATNGMNGESMKEEKALPNKENKLSEESFKGRLPSTSTPGTVAKKAIIAAKQKKVSGNNNLEESESGSGSSESSDEDVDRDGNDSTRYLDAVQKVHSKKLLEAYSESESEESSEAEEESPKPAPVLATPKQPAANATGSNSSSSEEETTSSDENALVETKYKITSKPSQQAVKTSPIVGKASPHAVTASPYNALFTKTAPLGLSPKQKASVTKTATPPSSRLLQQTHKVAAQHQGASTSTESSDSEEEPSPRNKSGMPALGLRMASLPPRKDDSSSEDEDEEIVSAWAK